jgi:hypothetical protein
MGINSPKMGNFFNDKNSQNQKKNENQKILRSSVNGANKDKTGGND